LSLSFSVSSRYVGEPIAGSAIFTRRTTSYKMNNYDISNLQKRYMELSDLRIGAVRGAKSLAIAAVAARLWVVMRAG
jgi:hypothetical protein